MAKSILTKSKKKSQVWFTDFMVGMLLFVIVIIIYYEYAHGLEQNTNKITSDLIMDAKSIGSSLITSGSPPNWTVSDVSIIGITDGKQRIDQEKLNNLASMNSSAIRSKLRTSYESYIYFEYLNGTRILVDGKEGIGSEPTDYDDLISIIRILIYESDLVRMVVQVWQ